MLRAFQKPDPEDGACVPEAAGPALFAGEMAAGFGLASVMRAGGPCGERTRTVLALPSSLLLPYYEPVGNILWVGLVFMKMGSNTLCKIGL